MLRLLVAVLTLFAFGGTSVWATGARTFDLRQFNAGQDAYYAGASGGAPIATFQGGAGCEKPNANERQNAKIRCTSSGCRVKCKRGYKMGDSRALFMPCESGVLTYLGQPWRETMPTCLPQCGKSGCPAGSACVAPNTCETTDLSTEFECDPPCQNGGICIFPDVCDCPLGYWSLLCEKHRCSIPDEIPANANFGGDADITILKVECDPGYQSKTQSSSATFICEHGQWLSEKQENIKDVDVNCYA